MKVVLGVCIGVVATIFLQTVFAFNAHKKMADPSPDFYTDHLCEWVDVIDWDWDTMSLTDTGWYCNEIPLSETKTFTCRKVVTCPRSDWRYTEPEDVCTYEMVTITAATDPMEPYSYGEYCNEVLEKI